MFKKNYKVGGLFVSGLLQGVGWQFHYFSYLSFYVLDYAWYWKLVLLFDSLCTFSTNHSTNTSVREPQILDLEAIRP